MTQDIEIFVEPETQSSKTDKVNINQNSLSAITLLSTIGAAALVACGSNEEENQSNSNNRILADGDQLTQTPSSTAQLNGTTSYVPPGATTNGSTVSARGFNNYAVAASDADASRFLMQSQFNATDAEIVAVKNSTFLAYLQQQFAKPIGHTGFQWLEDRGYGISDANNYFFSTYPAEGMLWNQLFTSQDAMRKRVALALSEFFVVSLQSAEFTWRSHAFAQYWDILVKNAFGNFRQLLEDVTLSPAMGYYLNTKGNQKEDPATGRVPDENYGREVMQLFSIGLYQLNLDGTEKLDVNGKKIETYTQSDVTNIARVFTGYDFDAPASERFMPVGQTYSVEGKQFTSRPMKFDTSRHSTVASTFLGATVPAGASGTQSLKIALDTLYLHPNVGPFFGKQMIQRFVTSNPSPAYIARVAAAFNNNGAGVRGDLKAVWTAIFLDDEARRNPTQVPTAGLSLETAAQKNDRISSVNPPHNTAATNLGNAVDKIAAFASLKSLGTGIGADPNRGTDTLLSTNFGKLREPMLRFIQWGRTFGLSPASPEYIFWKIPETSSTSNSLGQSPLRSPSVFNYFRPGFIPSNTALVTTNTVAPEFQLVNETTVGGYLNYMQDVIRNGLRSYIDPAVPQQSYPPSLGYKLHTVATYTSELALVSDASALIKRVNLLLAAGQISDANQTLMINAITSMPINSANATTLASQKLDRICAAVLMVMASSEYLIQK